MSPASYLTAPPRGVSKSLAPLAPRVTIGAVYDWVIYGALIASGVVLALATVRLVTQVLRTWRDFKRTRRRLVKELDRFTASAEALAEKIAAAEGGTARAEESVARLRVSLARLKVLTDAIDEVDATFGRFAVLSALK
jgi:predicted nuclease with TOPRIM domain